MKATRICRKKGPISKLPMGPFSVVLRLAPYQFAKQTFCSRAALVSSSRETGMVRGA